jgi:hypothetical protein
MKERERERKRERKEGRKEGRKERRRKGPSFLLLMLQEFFRLQAPS